MSKTRESTSLWKKFKKSLDTHGMAYACGLIIAGQLMVVTGKILEHLK